MSVEVAGIISVVIFILLGVIQLALALGAPIGQIAWGGKHEGKLPRNLRIGSVVTIGIFVLISLAVIDKASLADIFANSQFSTIVVWIFAFFLALNTLGNLASKSKYEKIIMTPLSLTACVCLFIVVI